MTTVNPTFSDEATGFESVTDAQDIGGVTAQPRAHNHQGNDGGSAGAADRHRLWSMPQVVVQATSQSYAYAAIHFRSEHCCCVASITQHDFFCSFFSEYILHADEKFGGAPLALDRSDEWCSDESHIPVVTSTQSTVCTVNEFIATRASVVLNTARSTQPLAPRDRCVLFCALLTTPTHHTRHGMITVPVGVLLVATHSSACGHHTTGDCHSLTTHP